jgi:hypothetical protein
MLVRQLLLCNEGKIVKEFLERCLIYSTRKNCIQIRWGGGRVWIHFESLFFRLAFFPLYSFDDGGGVLSIRFRESSNFKPFTDMADAFGMGPLNHKTNNFSYFFGAKKSLQRCARYSYFPTTGLDGLISIYAGAKTSKKRTDCRGGY